MLPMLPGIQELVKVMRSDRLDYIHSDLLASSGLYRNDFVDPDNVSKTVIPNGVQRNTLAGQAYGTTTDASLPDVVRDSIFQPTEPKPDVVASQFHEFPNFSKNSTSFSEAQTIQTPKPVYTLLTSKKKLHSTKPDTRSPRINELSKSIRNSTIPSEIHKTSPKPSYTVFTSKDMFPPARPNPELMNTGPNELSKSTISPSVLTSNTMFPSARSNPDLINTGPNEPSRSATRPPACHPTNVKFQMILPKPIYTKPIRDTNTKCSSASPLLYQLLKRNTPSTASACVTSETQLTSSNPVIPTSNKNTICSPVKPTPPNSGLNTLPKSNSNSTKSYPQFQQTATQVVTIVPSSTKGQNCCTKSVTKVSTKSNNRQSTSKRVESCVPHESSCDGNLSDVKVKLAREELWKLFYDQGNEMIVGKNGRPMFPTLELSVSGLRADEMYSISVRFICVDKYRYYFYTSCGKWGPTYEDRHQPGKPAHSRCFEHPASPTNGHNWCAKPLTFRELRLTNRATKAKNMVYAPTLRKHRVQLVVTMLRCSRCRTEHTRYIDIPLTEFIAVSSYYSVKMTELKIAHNPLAKTRCPQRKRKNCNRKSPEDVPTSRTKKQKTGEDTENEISERNLLASALLPRPINSSDSTHVTMLHNQHLSTATSTQLSTMPDLNTFSILQSTSNSKLPTILSFVAPSVLQSTSRSLNILPSTSSSQLPPISSQTTIISSSSSIEPTRPFLPIPTSTYPQPPMIKPKGDPKMLSQNTLTAKEQCNTVYTCQTTKPTAHVQTDDDILEYIKIYLSPFLTSEKNEVFDSSVFDELFNVNYISEKLDNFDLIQHVPLC